MELDVCQKRLARIRGVHRCIDNFKNGEPFPKELCFVPAEVEYSLVPCGKVGLASYVALCLCISFAGRGLPPLWESLMFLVLKTKTGYSSYSLASDVF